MKKYDSTLKNKVITYIDLTGMFLYNSTRLNTYDGYSIIKNAMEYVYYFNMYEETYELFTEEGNYHSVNEPSPSYMDLYVIGSL